jgi:hypothetical protein
MVKAEVDLTADEGEGKPALKIKLGGKTIGAAPRQDVKDGVDKLKAKPSGAATPKSKAAPKAKAAKEAAGKPASRKRQRKGEDDEDNVRTLPLYRQQHAKFAMQQCITNGIISRLYSPLVHARQDKGTALCSSVLWAFRTLPSAESAVVAKHAHLQCSMHALLLLHACSTSRWARR